MASFHAFAAGDRDSGATSGVGLPVLSPGLATILGRNAAKPWRARVRELSFVS